MNFQRYENYKDSGIEWLGEVPEHWNVKRLKYTCDVFPSNIDKKSYEGEIPVSLCNYTDVYYNDRITKEMKFMEATASKEQIAKFVLRAGDIVVTKDSETADDIAIAAYVPSDLLGVVCGYHLSMIRPFDENNGLYVKRLFDSHYLKSCVTVLANGLTRVGLSQSALDNLVIPLPPPKEQTTISTFLDYETAKIDTLIAEQQRLIELLKEKRQAVISHAVTKGLNSDVPMKNSGVEWLGEIPTHWEVWKLTHAFELIGSGTTPKSDNLAYYEEGTIAWLNTGDLNDGELFDCEKRITELAIKDHSSLSLYPTGSLVMAMYGATIGKLAMLRFPSTVNQACCVFAKPSQIVPKFMFYWLVGFRQQIVSMALGGGQPNISQEILRNFRIACPDISEQSSLATQLDIETTRIDTLITQANKAITLLQERRTTLISVAVTGKIDVRGTIKQEVL